MSLAGFGVTQRGGLPPDVTLNRMSSTIISDSKCLGPPDDLAGAVLVCAFSGSNSPCHGDSGSALVLTTPTPVAVGVTGAGTCDANTAAEFADLTAPEILQFVQGNDDPPLAPRPTGAPTLAGPTQVPQVGQTLRCTPGSWTEAPALAYAFLEGTNDLVLRAGSSSVRAPDRRRRAKHPSAASRRRPPAAPASRSRLRPSRCSTRPTSRSRPRRRDPAERPSCACASSAGRGRSAGSRSAPPAGPRIGGRACTTTAAAGPAVALRFPVKRAAPTGNARVSVTARGADGRSAAGSGVLVVR